MEEDIEKQDLSKIVLRGSFYNFVSLFIIKFGGLLFTIVIARILLPELFGIYALALSIATIAMTLTDLGLNNTFLRYFSDAIGKREDGKAKGYLDYLAKIKISLILLVVFILLSLARYLSYTVYQKPLLFFPLIFSCLYVISESIGGFFMQFILARKDFKTPVFIEAFLQTLKIGISVLILLVLTGASRVSGIFLSFFFAGISATVVLLTIVLRKNKEVFKSKKEKINSSKVNSYWKYMVMTSVSLAFFGSIDMLMLGKFVSSDYLGHYRVAMSLVLTIAALLSMSGGMFLPIFTQIKDERFQRGFQKVTRYMVLLSIPAAIGALFVSKYLIFLIYGKEYLLGATTMYLLVPLIITTPLISIYSIIFQSKEKPHIVSNAILFSLIANVLFNILAIISFKGEYLHTIEGVGFATSLSRVLLFGILVISAKKNFNFDSRSTGFGRPLLASLIMAVFLLWFNYYFDINLISGIIEIVLGAVIYFVVLFLIKGLGKEDITLLRKFFKK